MKKLYNKSERNYVHSVQEGGKIVTYRLKPKSDLLVPDDVAKIWLRSHEIMEMGAQDSEKDKEIARLKAELAKKSGEANTEGDDLEALRARAKELKVKGYANAKAETLKRKIAEAELLLASE